MSFSKQASLLLTLIGIATTAHANGLTFNLNYVFSGATPAGTSPWLTLKVEDGLAPETVRLTFDAANLSDTEFVSAWYVNFNPSLNPSQLSFAIVPPNPTQLSVGGIQKGINAFKADGDGYYDLLFDFPPPPGSFAAKFTADETVVVDVTRSGGISASDFLYQSVNSSGNGVYFTAAHIQGIGSDSAWVGATASPAQIPEPATAAAVLGATALIGVVVYRRRR